MAILASDGTTVVANKTAMLAKTTEVPSELVAVNEDIFQTFNYAPYEDRFKNFEGERKLLFKAGQVVRKSEIDFLYQLGTIASISPATGPAAGGTPVTIRGTRFSGATGVTFGGTAATSFVRVNDTTITCVTPAKTAGAYDVVVLDDGGNLTLEDGYTYV